MTLYEAYVAGWNTCMTGGDGRYWFIRPEECNGKDKALQLAFNMGFGDAFDAEDGEEVLSEEFLSLDDFFSTEV